MKNIICCSYIFLIALFFLASGAFGDNIQANFGGTNMGYGAWSSSTLSTQSTGSYSDTSSLNFNSGVTLTESVLSNGLDLGPTTKRVKSNDNNNYAELYWFIKNPTDPNVFGYSESKATPDSIGLSQSYSFKFADEAHFRATAVNWRNYKAEISSDILKGGIKSFSHEAKASNSAVSASQKLDDVWADTVTRNMYAKGATSTSSQKITTQTIPASSSRTSDYLTDLAMATSSKTTITPKPTFPLYPPYQGWPCGPGWPW